MMRSSAVWVFLCLAACKGPDKDGDGYHAKVDCDDGNASVYPGATEICNGLDDDCNGTVDDGLDQTWYADTDADGYGDPNTTVEACSQPSGYVADNSDCNDESADFHPGAAETDCSDPNDYNCDGSVGYIDADSDGYAACEECNDADPAINPGASDLCDGVDNNCDNVVDGYGTNDPGPNGTAADDATQWFIDYDDDGYGSDAYSVYSCDEPDGNWSTDNTDCDDTWAAAHPGADEVCDSHDDDCDGTVDGPNALDATTLYPDNDGDGYGDDAGVTVTCETLAGYIAEGGDCDDSNADVNPDADEICNNGIDDNCDGTAANCTLDLVDADYRFLGESGNDSAGNSVVGVGDVDLDGYDDILIGAKAADIDGSGDDEGAMYLVYGPSTAGLNDLADATRFAGETESGQFGYKVAAAGDFDGDGRMDLAATAPSESDTYSKSGELYLFLAENVGTADKTSSDADYKWHGEASFDYMGGGLAGLGDFDGDGYDDLAVGAGLNDGGGNSSGKVYVLFGESGSQSSADVGDAAGLQLTGESSGDKAVRVTGPGDVDGDGLDDLLVGVHLESTAGTEAGAVYFVQGGTTGSGSLGDADMKLLGASASDRLGTGIAGAGDMDGDGYADLLLGAPLDDTAGANAGIVYLVNGAGDMSTLDGSSVDSVAAATVTGMAAEQNLGGEVAGGQDFDHDGSPDLLIGVSSDGTSEQGAAYLLYGPISGSLSVGDADAIMVGDEPSDYVGSSVAFAGDFDGSGNSALLIGASGDNENATDAGAAYVVLSLGE